MGFEFSATAQCDLCGAYLDSSDEMCEHDGGQIRQHVFRRLSSDNLFIVRASDDHKWQKVADTKGEEWYAWVYLGTKPHVARQRGTHSVEDLSHISMAHEVTGIDTGDE